MQGLNHHRLAFCLHPHLGAAVVATATVIVIQKMKHPSLRLLKLQVITATWLILREFSGELPPHLRSLIQTRS